MALEALPKPLDERLDYGHALYARSGGHLIARSAEPGEDWSWCYLDNIGFVLTRR